MFERAKALYAKNAQWVPVVFFVLGFLFDVLTLQRIDDLLTNAQQVIYLAVVGGLLSLELLEQCGKYRPGGGLWSKAWRYREAVIHFILGSLLSAYAIFYFKSASVLTSFLYVGFLVAILIVNEFKRFGGSQTVVHMAFWNLCLVSFSGYIVPTLMGFIGVLPFLAAMLCSALISGLLVYRLRKSSGDTRLVTKRVLVPFAGIHVLFLALYFTQVIPPVPLSVSFIGIYHDLKKERNKYTLTYLKKSWNFWHQSDKTFVARRDDKIYCFARIFSPTRFQDKVMVRWLYRDPKGRWQSADAIPMEITGGREEGFRGYTVKGNYAPGDWRCQIETSDNREIGRFTFHVALDDTTGDRPVRTVIH